MFSVRPFISCIILGLLSASSAWANEYQQRIERNFLKLKPGMTQAEVKRLVGKPTHMNFEGPIQVHYYHKVNPPSVITYRNKVVYSVKNDELEIERRHEIKTQKNAIPPVIFVNPNANQRALPCTGENRYGTYAAGGGCNRWGCWPPAGNCSRWGCTYTSEVCGRLNCKAEIETYTCSGGSPRATPAPPAMQTYPYPKVTAQDLRCTQENFWGKFPEGGGCNVHGCWPAGGSCGVHGCSAAGKCSLRTCPDKINSYDCKKAAATHQSYPKVIEAPVYGQPRQANIRDLKCVGENFHGKYAQGGGCNFHGCWPPGGSCEFDGCSMTSSSCSDEYCPDKVETFSCVQ